MDPRVRTSAADLALQFKLSKSLDEMMRQIARVRADVEKTLAGSSGAPAARLRDGVTALQQAGAALVPLFESIQRADARPTAAQEAAVGEALKKAEASVEGVRSAGESHPLR
jgi:hypothetical protein